MTRRDLPPNGWSIWRASDGRWQAGRNWKSNEIEPTKLRKDAVRTAWGIADEEEATALGILQCSGRTVVRSIDQSDKAERQYREVGTMPAYSATDAAAAAERNGFFVIWNPGSAEPSQKIFSSLRQANVVAERMAAQNPGEKFYVLEAVTVSQVQGIATRNLPRQSYDLSSLGHSTRDTSNDAPLCSR